MVFNQDPYCTQPRIRRFYVSKQLRRTGIGSYLLNERIAAAKKTFQILVLHTDTSESDPRLAFL
ncbi:GNAT family N-acetyltransferase [Cytobacillus purgationiresistens]|uniref:GNAT family N-acetyltransferase n=1 Tax=Cytobacillus purgationiresistens TaxID=863449 RepID=UPI003522E5EC